MKTYSLMLDGNYSIVRAEFFRQDNDFVSFYTRFDKQADVVALIRLGPSDSIVEERTLVSAETS